MFGEGKNCKELSSGQAVTGGNMRGGGHHQRGERRYKYQQSGQSVSHTPWSRERAEMENCKLRSAELSERSLRRLQSIILSSDGNIA